MNSETHHQVPQSALSSPRVRYSHDWLKVLALAGVYAVTGRLGLELAHVGQNVTLLWAPTGISLAALLVYGRHLWLGVFAGSLITSALSGLGPVPALIIGVGNTLQPWLAATWLQKSHFEKRFLARRDVGLFVVYGILVPPMVSALVGALTLSAFAVTPWNTVPGALLVWWLGDATGVLVVAPALLALLGTKHNTAASKHGGKFEASLIVLSALVILGVSFQWRHVLWQTDLLLIPLILWTAIRFGATGVSYLSVLIAIGAVAATAHGRGPFVSGTPQDSVAGVWAFTMVLGLTGLLLTALLAEQHRAEQQREAQERQFKDIFENASFGLLLASPGGEILQVNRCLANALGYDVQRLKGTALERIDKDGHLYQAIGELTGPDKLQYSLKTTLVRADQGEITTEITVIPTQSLENGDPLVLLEVEDLSERERQQQEREALESQLQHTQLMGSVGQLAGGIAHDFNNLLLVILAHCDLAQTREAVRSDPQLKKFIAEIEKAGEQATTLAQQLLSLSRKEPLKKEIIDASELILRVHSVLSRVFPRDIQFVMELGGAACSVSGDAAQLEQVLVNLCINGRDAMPNGGTLTLGVRLQKDHSDEALGESSDEPVVVLSVKDTGIGMDDATRSRIFEPFFTTKGRGHGTGLGLSTARSIIQKHEGHILVDSSPGHGTTFQVQLPYVHAPAIQEQPKPEPPKLEGQGQTILVVDDEPSARRLFERILNGAGYQTLVAADGVAAVEAMEAHGEEVSLIIMDVVMPRMTGREAYERIAPRFPNTRVLFTSGYTADALPPAFLKQHGLKLLAKPFNRRTLLEQISQQLCQ